MTTANVVIIIIIAAKQEKTGIRPWMAAKFEVFWFINYFNPNVSVLFSSRMISSTLQS